MSDRPGWDFLDAQLGAVHGDAESLVFRSLLPAEVDPHPCKQVIAFAADGHWHLVAYGLTELFAKVSRHAEQDGFGFELTMRVPRDDEAPPRWAVALLRSLVEYVDQTGHPFGVGHFIPLPDRFGPGATLAGATFAPDPSLGIVTGPFGRFGLRQVVGLTADELDATMAVDDGRVIEALRAVDRWLVTDPRRTSVFDGPHPPERPAPPSALARAAASYAATVLRLTRSLSGDREVQIGADDAATIADSIEARLAAGRAVELASELATVRFAPADASTVSAIEGGVEVAVASADVGALVAALRAGPGPALALPGVRVRVVER